MAIANCQKVLVRASQTHPVPDSGVSVHRVHGLPNGFYPPSSSQGENYKKKATVSLIAAVDKKGASNSNVGSACSGCLYLESFSSVVASGRFNCTERRDEKNGRKRSNRAKRPTLLKLASPPPAQPSPASLHREHNELSEQGARIILRGLKWSLTFYCY
ncbi:hypothetical protein EVAR_65107_1 [Eumeta japonica]|uniref:Uncharacterized protein n=1 Tax=Eumeta variegata TaxID=151549 RepID=A0A4C1ZWL7_EUMVA|nr:hypothetical protein EVAR_65107_1 [Eumeta japonica]